MQDYCSISWGTRRAVFSTVKSVSQDNAQMPEHLGCVRQELLQAAHRSRQLRQRLRLQWEMLFAAIGLSR